MSTTSSLEATQEKAIADLFQKAIEDAFSNAKGWASPEEREAYIRSYIVKDDDYLPPLFCETAEELEKSGMADVFSALLVEDAASQKMMQCKQQGNDSFVLGKKNLANNKQYYRDATNHYYQAIAWAEKVPCVEEETVSNEETPNTDLLEFTKAKLDEQISILYANAAMAHLQLKNWGHCKDDATKAISFHPQNVKAWYRLAKAHQMLQNWEEAGDAIENGLLNATNNTDTDLIKLQKLLEHRIRRARQDRQKRERIRAERIAKIKEVWKHCSKQGIRLGRVALVSSISEEDDEEDDEHEESRWHSHFPHTGKLPSRCDEDDTWSWPCMFLYPSHRQSDFIEQFGENEMIASRLAQVFPDDDDNGTAMPWDYNNEFVCSQLAVYFEVHNETIRNQNNAEVPILYHPESVEPIEDLSSAIRFYESSRALRGDEGPEMENLARAVERKHLFEQRKAWRLAHKTLHHKPDPCPVVRVHPAVTLKQILTDSRMVVPSFICSLFLFPENHPAHKEFLKEHKCVGIIQPN